MSTVAKPELLVETRKVYCQSAEVAALLARQDPPLETLPLPEHLLADETSPCVVIGDNPAVFTTELRDAIAQNRARLIYFLRDDSGLPAEASGAPIFSFLTPPLQVAVVASTVKAAFDNLDLHRRQATLEQDLLRARSEIDELNQIGIALSTQRDRKSTRLNSSHLKLSRMPSSA